MPDQVDPPGEGPSGLEGQVMVLTAEEVPLDVRPIDSDLLGEGQVCLGTHFRQRLIARNSVDAARADVVQEILARPVQVGLLASDEDGGVRGNLVALLPRSRIQEAVRKQELEREPWKASLEPPPPMGASGESGADSAPVLVPLGELVRLPAKRVSPDDLRAEAEDMLLTIMARGARSLVDDVLDEL